MMNETLIKKIMNSYYCTIFGGWFACQLMGSKHAKYRPRILRQILQNNIYPTIKIKGERKGGRKKERKRGYQQIGRI